MNYTGIKLDIKSKPATFRLADLPVILLRIGCVLLAAILFGGCTEQINFDIERRSGFLVVDGSIHDGPGPYTLKLSRTTGQGSPTTPVSGASIAIYDEQGNSEFYFEAQGGTYILPGNEVQGSRGGSYYIEIDDGNGIYRSELGTIPGQTASDSAYYEIATEEELSDYGILVEKEVLRVYADTFIPETDSALYLRWDVHELYKYTEYDEPDPFNAPPPYCYVTQYPNPQTVTLFETDEDGGNLLRGNHLSTTEIDFSFYQRHYFNIVLTSTTRRAYEYWQQVDEVVNRAGTIFDVPPATVKGNLYRVGDQEETVLGYFETAIIDTTRFYTLRQDIPFFIGDPCSRSNRNRHYACSNCLELPYSSKEEPYYWLEERLLKR